ncbi:Uncharacterised protein r2_g4166 [Pycnogonum litorale]
MSKVRTPECFTFSEPNKWPSWKERFQRFRLASKLHTEDGEVQVSSLIYCMGADAEQIFKQYRVDSPTDDGQVDPRNDCETVLKELDKYFLQK